MPIDQIRIEIANRSDSLVTGLRLRIEGGFPTWGVYLDSDSLVADEMQAWKQAVSRVDSGTARFGFPSRILLPELPPIEPQGELTITGYGDLSRAVVFAKAPNKTVDIVSLAEVRDRFPFSVLIHPMRYFHLIALAVGLAGWFLVWILGGVWNRIHGKEKKAPS